MGFPYILEWALHFLQFLIKGFAHFLLFLNSFNLDRATVFAHFSKMPGSSNVKFWGAFRKMMKIIHVKFQDLVMHSTGVIWLQTQSVLSFSNGGGKKNIKNDLRCSTLLCLAWLCLSGPAWPGLFFSSLCSGKWSVFFYYQEQLFGLVSWLILKE